MFRENFSFWPDPEIGRLCRWSGARSILFLDVYLLGDRERIVDLDAEITHGAFHLRMAK